MAHSAFRTKEDVLRYFLAFSSNDFAGFSGFYAPDVRMILGDKVSLNGGPDAIVDFFQKWRKSINEHLDVDHIVLDEHGCAIRATATFTAIVDLNEGFMDWGPPVPKGGGYRRKYIVFYTLNGDAKVTSIQAARMGDVEVFKP
ncbi:hypothetical protein SLS56_011673 [Neofusicoccum ribis]|uniref:SnoaL-like domain-containing protein n=1 Tax=Neofusicoccum ribis TaxID=45134 RepID=A0ABR3SBZ0_9PEZI